LPRSRTGSSKPCGQALDEVEHVDVAGGLAQVSSVISRCRADVFGDGAGEEERVLQDDGEVLAQLGQVLLAQVHAVEQNLPAVTS
jgi:hypothetical protein